MTVAQRYTLGHHMLKEGIERIQANTGDDFATFLLPRLVGHWAFTGEGTEDEVHTRAALATWAANAMQILMLPSEVAEYTDWRKKNKLPGFAGDRLPDTALPCANVWFEAAYAPGKYPTLVPIRDVVSTSLVKVKKIGILATHQYSTNPFPEELEGTPNFLRTATVVAFVEDAINQIHVFAGVVSYGVGGALMWKVNNVAELTQALHGLPPRANSGGPLSNLSQFACGELAYLIHFYGNTPYSEFKAQHSAEPATAMGEDYDEQ